MPPTFFDDALREVHTSYLRMNYYPPNSDPVRLVGSEPTPRPPPRDVEPRTASSIEPPRHSIK